MIKKEKAEKETCTLLEIYYYKILSQKFDYVGFIFSNHFFFLLRQYIKRRKVSENLFFFFF